MEREEVDKGECEYWEGVLVLRKRIMDNSVNVHTR